MLTNIRLGWKGLPGTNALAYYKKVITFGRKFFIALALLLALAPSENGIGHTRSYLVDEDV